MTTKTNAAAEVVKQLTYLAGALKAPRSGRGGDPPSRAVPPVEAQGAVRQPGDDVGVSVAGPVPDTTHGVDRPASSWAVLDRCVAKC